MRIILLSALCLVIFGACSAPVSLSMDTKPLTGMVITLDPGHGNTSAYDHFRVGPNGEREEWINLRVARYLERYLTNAGATVVMTRDKDTDVNLGGRAAIARQAQSDLFISIHHNGASDTLMDYPLIYFHGSASENPASVDFAILLIEQLHGGLEFEQSGLHGVFSDYLIYPAGTAVLRNTYPQLPGVIGEPGFFTNPEGAARLAQRRNNRREAQLYLEAVLGYAARGIPKARPILPADTLPVLHPADTLAFQLDDGRGTRAFLDSSIRVISADSSLEHHWEPDSGLLLLIIPETEEHTLSVQIYGRNIWGNALHPRQWEFLTAAGERYYQVDSWRTAYRMADSAYTELGELLESSADSSLKADGIQRVLGLYQLSLDLQLVHLHAVETERRILELLNQLHLYRPSEALNEEIRLQAQRIPEFYPYVRND